MKISSESAGGIPNTQAEDLCDLTVEPLPPLTITRRYPPSHSQMDSPLRSSNFMAEQSRHPREGLRQMHSLASYSSVSSIGPQFYRLGQDGRRRLYSNEDVSGVAPVTHSSSAGATNQLAAGPSLQTPPTNPYFATLMSTLALAIISVIAIGVLFRILCTQQSVSEDLLGHLCSTTLFPVASHRVRALEEAVQQLTVRTQSLALEESRFQALEEAVQRLTVRLDDTAQSLADRCSARRIQHTCMSLINEFEGENLSRGAKVVRELTTTGTESQARRSWLPWVQQSPPRSLHTPDSVLLDGRARVGDCWDMRRQAGQIGISLPRTVVVTHLTVDHIPQELISDIERAPKHAVLWGVVDGKSNFKKAEGLEILHPPEFYDVLSARQGPPTSAGYNYVPLAYIIYNISREEWVQTVPVTQDIARLTMDFGVVVFEVLDNWGGDSTCLYRVRIHGE